ncbi:hypothetical protein RFI_06086 [Reticulomyxa filosa]|uniref:Uncharacterized protein n=1 Tax=Reticulomyxa filosa TaxID=46433 RepID=X6NYX0_RETFI|nr:hypothetical protein RFI_06086 [Reticulomyxa filosa]|eukprot:ETO31034.1 hypothetical protein RFI_06086 [Reticulomyxa filosa]
MHILYLAVPAKLNKMVAWFDIIDSEFLRYNCEYFCNLSFNESFKTAFYLNEQLIIKIFNVLIDQNYENEILQTIKSHNKIAFNFWPESDQNKVLHSLSIKLSLATLLWKLIYHNQKVDFFFQRKQKQNKFEMRISIVYNTYKYFLLKTKINDIRPLLP